MLKSDTRVVMKVSNLKYKIQTRYMLRTKINWIIPCWEWFWYIWMYISAHHVQCLSFVFSFVHILSFLEMVSLKQHKTLLLKIKRENYNRVSQFKISNYSKNEVYLLKKKWIKPATNLSPAPSSKFVSFAKTLHSSSVKIVILVSWSVFAK